MKGIKERKAQRISIRTEDQLTLTLIGKVKRRLLPGLCPTSYHRRASPRRCADRAPPLCGKEITAMMREEDRATASPARGKRNQPIRVNRQRNQTLTLKNAPLMTQKGQRKVKGSTRIFPYRRCYRCRAGKFTNRTRATAPCCCIRVSAKGTATGPFDDGAFTPR
jgi:hypothetical protein